MKPQQPQTHTPTEIRGANGDLVFLPESPLEITKAVSNYAALQATNRELVELLKLCLDHAQKRYGHVLPEFYLKVALRAQEVTK